MFIEATETAGRVGACWRFLVVRDVIVVAPGTEARVLEVGMTEKATMFATRFLESAGNREVTNTKASVAQAEDWFVSPGSGEGLVAK